jgi:hypothetical protein
MARQNIHELMALKKRSGRRGGRFPDANDIGRLREAWANCTGPKELFASLLPARLVTLVEVFCQYWVQKLIEHGPPYDERAIDLKVNIKYDLPLVRSLHGQKLSLGFLISNNVTLSEIAAISAIFSILVQTDFFHWLSNVRYRTLLEHEPDGGDPIVTDMDKLKRTLARIFEVRHILIHEFPEKLPFATAEISEMIDAADNFISAADEGFTQLLYGLYPINQQAMNQKAREESKAIEEELDRLVDHVAKKLESDTIRKVQQAWLPRDNQGETAASIRMRMRRGWTDGARA